MRYAKYAWVGNRISDNDMKILYQLKLKNKKPITVMVAEAVRKYVAKRN
jgi:hypothetical protein